MSQGARNPLKQTDSSIDRASGQPHSCDAVLVIGVHREELAFGDEVAAGLDPSLADLLRIPEGLSGRRPRQDQLFYYETLHRELYHQLAARIRGRYRLALDLHCGIDEGGPCADLISRDPELLARIEERAVHRFGGFKESRPLRAVLLGDVLDARNFDATTPAKTVIPKHVWNDADFEYVGLEVYLSSPGVGSPSDRRLARWVIRTVIEYRNSRNVARLVGARRRRAGRPVCLPGRCPLRRS